MLKIYRQPGTTKVLVTFTAELDLADALRTETPVTWEVRSEGKLCHTFNTQGEAEDFAANTMYPAGEILKVVGEPRFCMSPADIDRHAVEEARQAMIAACDSHGRNHEAERDMST